MNRPNSESDEDMFCSDTLVDIDDVSEESLSKSINERKDRRLHKDKSAYIHRITAMNIIIHNLTSKV